MKHLKYFIAPIILIGWTTITFAGAVSGGGGGTTNPSPSKPSYVVGVVRHYAGQIITTWLHQQEHTFYKLTAENQLSSPYYRFFISDKSIYEVIESITVELEMTKPCYDAEGNVRDGSVHASKPGAICISPFTMAPKLTSYNYDIETVALLIHELAHLMGAGEPEAEAIQKAAILDLKSSSFLKVQQDLIKLSGIHFGGAMMGTMDFLHTWIKHPHSLKTSDINLWQLKFIQLGSAIGEPLGDFLFINTELFKLFSPQYVRSYAIEKFVCANDPREEPTMREYCQDALDKAFGADTEVTAREYKLRLSGIDLGADFDAIVIRKLDSYEDLSAELQEVRLYLEDVQEELKRVATFELRTKLMK